MNFVEAVKTPVKRYGQVAVGEADCTANVLLAVTRTGEPGPGALQRLRSEIRTQAPRFRTGKGRSLK